jgi:Protein of unknown function (DUF2281)
MTVSEKVIAALADLPGEQQTVVLDFIEFLRQKQQSAISLSTTNSQTTNKLEAMRETLKQVAGCMENAPSDLSTNSDYMEGFGQ